MVEPQIKINVFTLGEELTGALNDVGFGDNKDAAWFLEEFFHRIKKYYHGFPQTFINAEADTKDLLDYSGE